MAAFPAGSKPVRGRTDTEQKALQHAIEDLERIGSEQFGVFTTNRVMGTESMSPRTTNARALRESAAESMAPAVGAQTLRKGIFGEESGRQKKRDSVDDDPRRTKVSINGVVRPIRLETNDVEAETLNSLVREVKYAELNEKNQELSRRAKMVSTGRVVKRFHDERLSLSLEVPPTRVSVSSWEAESWRSSNIDKRRSAPENPLHYVAPELRRSYLRELERNTAKTSIKAEASAVQRSIAEEEALLAEAHPSGAASERLSASPVESPSPSILLPAGTTALSPRINGRVGCLGPPRTPRPDPMAPNKGLDTVPTPGGTARRRLKYW
eukprot:gnl/TRDRNA2_/TRDRNA2_181132_c0_seq1.p1 gnl/TRDRNA2_/TRDRNA2_181132_c0~~gnl/TRDRNA2_/TRDRNA2_181132_c0_seq1.p1  ORF type:complete len:352 (+),score=48.73 gnl/TRDRNA2_/TRDRNA2_181132_c0_seq1:83-1057(+)